MNLLNDRPMKNHSDEEMDVLLTHSLKNWASKQSSPAYVRTRILRKAAVKAIDGGMMQQLGKKVTMTIRGLNPYWTGRPLNHSETAKWLFSRAMMDCLRIDHTSLRVVC
jgi:ribosomal protein S8E